ncbi:MAG: endo-1,4-beta-xylanase [Paraprevotella sp.]|nr:endo-1,4-beta-xylanase [Paraprevotella sp.]
MKTDFSDWVLAGMLFVGCGTAKSPVTVKEYFKNEFLIGAAIPVPHVKGLDAKADSVVSLHFNSIVAENCMKCGEIHPRKDEYYWDAADAFVRYGEERGMAVIGHVLVWHSQVAPWFFYDSAGSYVTPEELKKRMHDHIVTVVGRYKGRIKGWDVVNEVIEDNGTYRRSPFYEILGEEFIPLAFQYAHEADPEAELYINDYSMACPPKREEYVRIVGELRKRGLRIDGIGMQSHIGLDYPDLGEYEKSIEVFGNTGLQVMITELDMTAIPTVHKRADVADNVAFKAAFNPYKEGLPENVSKQWNARMDSVFQIYRKHSDVISRVTWWGTHDGMSWRNDFPMRGRTDYPLLFDREYRMKQFMEEKLAR